MQQTFICLVNPHQDIKITNPKVNYGVKPDILAQVTTAILSMYCQKTALSASEAHPWVKL